MYIIDAHSLIFQVFHAIAEMSSPAGLPTNALFGFTRDVLFVREELKPDYLLCAFDRSEPTFRNQLYPEYKAHRAPMPDDLRPQIPLIEQMLEAMRIPVLSHADYEADDIIATVATAAAERGLDVLVCTTDKDCRQLISDRVRLYNLRKRDVMDRETLLRDWGVKPEQVVDLQALVGDSVDNVPGVPGIGVKTAAKLLQEFGTLENLLANIDRVAGAKKQENLRAASAKMALSRSLVRLATDVPLEMDWEGWRLQEPDTQRLLALFQEWGFHRFADQMRKRALTVPPPKPSRKKSESEPVQRDLFSLGGEGAENGEPHERGIVEHGARGGYAHPLSPIPQSSLKANWKATYHLVDTPIQFAKLVQALGRQQRFAIDLETMGLEARAAALVGLALCWQPGEAWYVAVRGPEGAARLDPALTLEQLRPILENPDIAKVNQNIKYDLLVLRQHGIALRGIAGDSMVADYLLHAGERSHSMEDLSHRYLNHQVIPITDLIGKKGKNQLRMDQVAPARIAEYSGEDADVAWRLCNLLESKLDEEGERDKAKGEREEARAPFASPSPLAKLYRELEIPLIEVLAELEFNGIRVDVPFLEQLSADMTRQLNDMEREIHALAGRSFNIASPRQLRQVLFEELRLPRQRKTGITGEASTDQETLERLAAVGHALPQKILEHRQIAKLKGTYVDALPGLVNRATGRVHASFNQTVAATGRLSSSDPNLQNIPVRREQGRQVRQAFLPDAGWVLLTADYSQVELRLLAHFCGDAELRRAFAEDRDIHALVAAQIFGVAGDAVSEEMRRMAKTVNFGVIYGMSAHGLAQRLGMPREEAGRFIDAYFGRYPKVASYQTELLKKCLRNRYVSTILGRRRQISGIRLHSTYQQRNQPEREAINMEIQGSAADLIKVAMLNIYRRLHRERRQARMLLQIHDELVFEVPPEELNEVAQLVSEEMTTALPLQVPLKVDLGVGPNWLDVSDYRKGQAKR
jgi:DNA polymerase-1